MLDKKMLYSLDDIGFIGTQERLPPAVQKYHDRKTAEMIKAIKAEQIAREQKAQKKAQ